MHRHRKKFSGKAKKQRPEPALPKKIFGIRFKNPRRLEAALTHPSYRNENPPGAPLENFDRLEFLGDSILNLVICRRLYALFPDADEGVLSRLRSILVSWKILARVAKNLKLSGWLKLGKSLEAQKDLLKYKIYDDSLEAFFAALYFDRGFKAVEDFILKHFRSFFDAKKLFRLDPNPKSTLQELAQKHWQKLPTYTSQMLPDGVKTVVSIHRTRQAEAAARTRRESEEKAARLLIRKIRQELVGRLAKKSSVRKSRKKS